MSAVASRNSLIATAIICFSFAAVLLFNFVNAGIILKEPDICFLLSMGRFIFEHQTIPQSDPFSYGYLLCSTLRPYVIYQWLSELIFYLTYLNAGGVGLLILSGLLTTTSFFLIPLAMLRSCGLSPLKSLLASFLLLLVSICHLSIRPEIFSYLGTAVTVSFLVWFYKQNEHELKRLLPKFTLPLTLIALLWVNLHCLYLILPLMLIFALICESLNKSKAKPRLLILCVTLTSVFLATLLNPYGINLYSAVAEILTNPINKTIAELRPIGLWAFADPIFYPFFALTIFAISQLPVLFKQKVNQPGQHFFLALFCGSIVLSFLSVRLIPIASLILLLAWGFLSSCCEHSSLQKKLNELLGAPFLLGCLAMSLIGSIVMARAIPPAIPQGSAAFNPPFAALKTLEKVERSFTKSLKKAKPPRLLNDPHFGALAMWELKNPPKLFIDPRYYMYDTSHVQDYWTMALTRDNWQEVIKKYQIDWIFLPSNSPLVSNLSKNSDWSLVFCDNSASILIRKSSLEND